MRKKYKLLLLALGVLLICSIVTITYLHIEIDKYQTTANIIGTFKPDNDNVLNTEYIVFEKDGTVVWYRAESPYATSFYEQGTLEKINEENVYKITFKKKVIHCVYYEDSLLLIDDDFAEVYKKSDSHPSYTGVKPPQ